MTTQTAVGQNTEQQSETPSIQPRLWIYTNFDCNLSCSYCLSSSSPAALRRALPLHDYYRLIDEASSAGIEEVFLTGGEPFLLPDIEQRIEYALRRAAVTVLTNGLVLRAKRVDGLRALRDLDFTLQVSLDGHRPELHDAYRGRGTWSRTVKAIRYLLAEGFHVAVGATGTPVNAAYEADLHRFVMDLGIREDDFLFRPLTKNGLSDEGLELSPEQVVPELTVTLDGVFWHPQSGGSAHLLSHSILPLQPSIDLLNATYERFVAGGPRPQVYRCA